MFNRPLKCGFLIYLFDCDANVRNANFAYRVGGQLGYMVCLNVNRLKDVVLEINLCLIFCHKSLNTLSDNIQIRILLIWGRVVVLKYMRGD